MVEADRKWYAVYTKARHEKVVAELLWRKEIESFLPLREVVSKWSDRRKLVHLPLFPGYLFVKVPMQKRRIDILKVPSVVNILGFNGMPEPIPDNQVDAVKQLVFSRLAMDPHPFLAEGDRVLIKRGPLRGLVGILLEKKSRFKFVLSVELIQQAVACEIDSADCERM